MEAITLPVYNSEGKKIESIKLDKKAFDGTVNRAALYQATLAYQAARRKGLASTKTIGETRGGGAKPWRQKGTGRARAGSSRSPLWRGGGVVFGPHPRSFSYALPHKIKKLALKSSLNAKVKDENIIILNELNLNSPKTKDAVKVFTNLNLINSGNKRMRNKKNYALVLSDKISPDLKTALANIGFLKLASSQNASAYDILSSRKLVVTQAGLKALIERIK
ncbi:MAG: 50S ribosomal protein L4 [Candidatus Omnitrophota bacterium]|nr:MAG: 50S ribosomal protein L4 [Candidatus Omnitrophota bacterium]